MGLKSRQDCSPYEHEIQRITGLSAAFVQQARDKALWMWAQYRETHKNWERELRRAKAGTKWYKKLLKREPAEPCTSARSKLKKIPTKFDSRTGTIEESHLKISPLVVRISTLKKGERITILLNPSKWHLDMLRSATELRGFELVKRGKKYFVHLLCKYFVRAQPVHAVRGVDLGVDRAVASVKLPKHPRNFSLLRCDDKWLRIRELNDRVSHLRRHVAEDYDRKLAKEFAACTENELVVIGDPQLIRYHKYRGDGNKRGRKILQNWSYSGLADGINREAEGARYNRDTI